ncbi:GntR family transcriptional regulator [Streptomyces qinglanensis]|uniref:DNA-binding transcriptional regulator, GntR family n=1 Tax=Streptomyces qinglanensis TaxID=943816 RepID=A0A1H9RZB1_9ACTN|nr:GntR family transcriptional regulator [Streptomyces qinglanensis]SER78067.1 DNA-binding transcriptional regulator, GntR family [Streptomyces qinglanensis]
MEQSRAESLAGPAAVPSTAAPPPVVLRPLAPAGPGPAGRAAAPSAARPRRAEGSARGEHTHCEPAAPKVVPQRHSVRDQILEALRGALLSGELAPGEVYSAPALGERFGVSPTPVREAMQLLASEGAVETVPNRGFRVAAHSPRDLAELTEIRALLEVPAILALARTQPPGHWAELRPLADDTLQAAACGDRTAYAETDLAFHRALLEPTGNRQLIAVAEDVQRRAQLSALRAAPAPRTTDLLAEAADHLALLDALADQDHPAVERLVRGHF